YPEMIARYLKFFERQGSPIDCFPLDIQESHLAPSQFVTTHAGRNLSTSFLYFLSAAYRIMTKTDRARSFLELGSGYGGLARAIKLMRPGVKYALLDMPHSLYFSMTFLRRHFPNAQMVMIDSPRSLDRINDEYDFCFIPVTFMEKLR